MVLKSIKIVYNNVDANHDRVSLSPNVDKMVKHMLKTFQQMLEDFHVCLTILWKE